jgi:hypothetical protein
LAEEHNNRHRAGFVALVLGNNRRGIELGFWLNEIWAQEGGVDDLFTHAEGAAHDATAALTEYALAIQGDNYTLSAAGSPILSGPLRPPPAFTGPIDPYETPNFLFLGDNTRSAAANTELAYIALTGATLPATPTPRPAPTAAVTPTNNPFPPHGSIWWPWSYGSPESSSRTHTFSGRFRPSSVSFSLKPLSW